ASPPDRIQIGPIYEFAEHRDTGRLVSIDIVQRAAGIETRCKAKANTIGQPSAGSHGDSNQSKIQGLRRERWQRPAEPVELIFRWSGAIGIRERRQRRRM